MRFAAIVASLVFAITAAALQVTEPDEQTIWSSNSAGVVTWNMVSTDRKNFTMIMVNPDFSVKKVLASNVDSSLGSLAVSPPSGGFPTGDNLRINFVQDNQHQDTVLAQSPQFTITQSSSSSASGTTSAASTITVGSSASSTAPSGSSTKASGSASGSVSGSSTKASGSASGSTSSPRPSSSNSAALPNGVQSGLVGAVAALVGAVAYAI